MKHLAALILAFLLYRQPTLQAQVCTSDSTHWKVQWEYGTGIHLPIHSALDEVNGNYLYVAAKSGGLMIFDVAVPGQATLKKTLGLSLFNSLEVMWCEQEGNKLYLALGNYFGTDLQPAGLAVVDITDPINPMVTDVWENEILVKGSAVVKVQQGYAYLGAMTDGLIILDVSDPGHIQWVSRFLPDPNWPLQNPGPTALPNARGMEVADNVVYLCYDAGGLRIINVADKLNPKETGRYINAAATGKQQAYNDVEVYNGLAYLGVDYCGMEIVEVTDTSNITQTGWWNPWDCVSPFNLWIGSPGHANEVTLDAAKQIVYLSAGASDLRVVDVSNPANPDSCSGFGSYTDTLAAYAATVSGERIFLTYLYAFIPYFSVWAGIKEVNGQSFIGTNSPPVEMTLSIFPNPATDHITVRLPSNMAGNLTITDVWGRNLITQSFDNTGAQEFTCPLPACWPAGIYQVAFATGTSVITKKVIRK